MPKQAATVATWRRRLRCSLSETSGKCQMKTLGRVCAELGLSITSWPKIDREIQNFTPALAHVSPERSVSLVLSCLMSFRVARLYRF